MVFKQLGLTSLLLLSMTAGHTETTDDQGHIGVVQGSGNAMLEPFVANQIIIEFEQGDVLTAPEMGQSIKVQSVSSVLSAASQSILAAHGARVLKSVSLPAAATLHAQKGLQISAQAQSQNQNQNQNQNNKRTQYLLSVDSTDVEALAQELSGQSDVTYAEPNYLYYTNSAPNDPYYQNGSMWGLTTLNLEPAWGMTQGAGTVVAVIDTGVYRNHPDLAANIWYNTAETPDNGVDDDGNGFIDDVAGWDFDESDNIPDDEHGHGTHVSGTIAAVGNNDLGVVGVAPQTKIMAAKALSDGGYGSTFNISKAIRYAADMGADVINMSLGGQGQSNAMRDAIYYAMDKGVVVVVAAGNSNINSQYQQPANVRGVISVGSLQNHFGLEPSSFSNNGPSVDVFAPGSSIISLGLQDNYTTKSGTSMAAPHVAGVVALMRSLDSSLTPADVRARLTLSATDYIKTPSLPGWDDQTGYGVVNPYSALTSTASSAQGAPDIRYPNVFSFGDNNVSVNGWVSIQGSTATDDLARYEIAIGTPTSAGVSFSTQYTGYQAVDSGELMNWNTASYSSGTYFLRLRTFDHQDRMAQMFQRVQVDHDLEDGWPQINSYWLGHPAGGFDGKNTARSPALIDLDNDGDLEILVVDNSRHYHRNIRAWNHDGTRFGSNSFIYANAEEIITPITIADINNDGEDDILFAARVVSSTERNSIFAYDKSGQLLPGFPTGWSGETYPNENVVVSSDGRVMAIDLTGDGNKEIVMQKMNWNNTRQDNYEWQVVAVDSAGQLLPGWPITAHFSDLSSLYQQSDDNHILTSADWFEDGSTDLIMVWPQTDQGVELRVVNNLGQVIDSIAFPTTEYSQVQFPLVVDIDDDGREELILQVGDQIHAYTMDGTMKPGWPLSLPSAQSRLGNNLSRSIDGLLVSDTDNDGDLELVLNSMTDEAFIVDPKSEDQSRKIDLNRYSSWGFPIHTLLDERSNQQALLYSSSKTQDYLEARLPNGESLPGWPKRVVSLSGSLTMGDVDQDGQLEAVGHSLDGFIYVWEMDHKVDTGNADWQYDFGNADQTRRLSPLNPTPSCAPLHASMNLRGTFNSWGVQSMQFDTTDCAWKTKIEFSAATEGRYKFDVSGDWQSNYGDNNSDGIADQNGADIPFNFTSGTYQVLFNDQTRAYQIEEVLPPQTSIEFTCHNGFTNVGDSVYVVGNLTQLGNWQISSEAQKLTPTSYPSWTGTVTELPLNTSVEWKCVIANEASFDIIQWQGGSNNRVTTSGGGSPVPSVAWF